MTTIALASWHWGPGACRHAQLVYWQHQCLSYAGPADQVVYEDDPTAALALLSADGYFKGRSNGAGAASVYAPRCVLELTQCRYTHTMRANPYKAILFIHQLTGKHGNTRLVTIECDPEWRPLGSMPGDFDVTIETLTPWFRDRTVDEVLNSQYPSGRHFGFWLERADFGTRFYAGQPDLSDPSHFTIRYERKGRKGIIDGWLNDDASPVSVHLEVRKGSDVEPIDPSVPLGPPSPKR